MIEMTGVLAQQWLALLADLYPGMVDRPANLSRTEAAAVALPGCIC
jgi:hypothetical protein